MTVTNSYADATHVQALLGALFTISANSTPTTTQVEGFLDQTAADIDGLLTDRGYGTVPATGTTDVLMLRKYTSMCAAVTTYYAAFGHDDAPANVQEWAAECRQFMTDLKEGKRRLVNQNPRARLGVVLTGRYIED